MSGDLLKFGGQGGSSWHYLFEQEALTDPQAAEANWFPEPRPSSYAVEFRAATRELNSIIRQSRPDRKPEDTAAARWLREQQAGRDALMRKIDKVLEIPTTAEQVKS